MEYLWEEFTIEERKYESLIWHKEALIETEKKMSDGKEQNMDWNKAKRLLRKEFK